MTAETKAQLVIAGLQIVSLLAELGTIISR